MPYPTPISDNAPSAPLRNDFPIEAGFAEDFRAQVRPKLGGKISEALRNALPLNLDHADYVRLADWADLPARLAYYETNDSNADRVVAVMLIPGVTIFSPASAFWADFAWRFAAQIDAGMNADDLAPWAAPRGCISANAQCVILHDRSAGTAHLVKFEDTPSLLMQSIRWNVPN